MNCIPCVSVVSLEQYPDPVMTDFTSGASHLMLSKPSRVSNTVTRLAEKQLSPVSFMTRDATIWHQEGLLVQERWSMHFTYLPMPNLFTKELNVRRVFLQEKLSVSQRQSGNLQGRLWLQMVICLFLVLMETDWFYLSYCAIFNRFVPLSFLKKRVTLCFFKGIQIFHSRIIRLSWVSDFGDNACLSLLIKNHNLNRPRKMCLVPSWDWGLDLKVLQFPPCEHLQSVSFKYLSYKCCLSHSFGY